jgi:glycosyltransferase involved in cell wall biosynthesis
MSESDALRDGLRRNGEGRRRLLVVSHVLPFPGESGQQLRVRHSLAALRAKFHVTVVTTAKSAEAGALGAELRKHCDATVIVPSGADDGIVVRAWRRVAGTIYCLWSGEKWSNYVIGRQQFSPSHLLGLARSGEYDCVLYEYWHANDSTKVFRDRGIPVVLDMHNILWQARHQQLAARPSMPLWLSRAILARYRHREERAWRRYDGLIAINDAEKKYAASRVESRARMFHVPMGIPLDSWSYQWQPTRVPRIAYYGGLRSRHNQKSALECVRDVMPIVWAEFPETELWLVGSNPPSHIQDLADSRVKITGFVKDVPSVLRSMTAVLCPWHGTYGFRSRVIEVMALGVPLIATPDAINGMELAPGNGLLLASNPGEMARHVVQLLRDPSLARDHSLAARAQVSDRFDFSQTYGRLAHELEEWIEKWGNCA